MAEKRSGSTRITVALQVVPFTAVTLFFSDLASGVRCSYAPVTVVAGSRPVAAMLTISSVAFAARASETHQLGRRQLLQAVALFTLGVPVIAIRAQNRRKNIVPTIVTIAVAIAVLRNAGGLQRLAQSAVAAA